MIERWPSDVLGTREFLGGKKGLPQKPFQRGLQVEKRKPAKRGPIKACRPKKTAAKKKGKCHEGGGGKKKRDDQIGVGQKDHRQPSEKGEGGRLGERGKRGTVPLDGKGGGKENLQRDRGSGEKKKIRENSSIYSVRKYSPSGSGKAEKRRVKGKGKEKF